ncbi:MAG: aminotransferase class I/II-fold pyridoxal phosphate-dependent enzyme [Synergistetes bacterium]|nr:aminotransferase class I/II-fold pyridoxal phosphate-dependent enzyme [Synergistota bacterium]
MVSFYLSGNKIRRSLLVLERESYVEEESPGNNLLDCSLGQNPFGVFKNILEGLDLEGFDLSSYPDPYHHRLKQALVERWKNRFKEEDVFVGSGSMGCLEKINKAFLKENSLVLGYTPQFTEYITEVKICGGVYEYLPLSPKDGFEFNADMFLDKLSEEYALIYIDNPNNPTGQLIPIESIRAILDKAYKLGVIVVIDEAYGDFIDDESSAINLDYPNLIVVRSFSKGFGLAGLRVGYAVIKGRELKKLYSKVNLPFAISSLSEEIALKAIKNISLIEESRAYIAEIKGKVIRFLCDRGFDCSKTSLSVPIFLLWREKENLYLYFKERGILCIDGKNFTGLNSSYVRIRIPRSFEDFLSKFEI